MGLLTFDIIKNITETTNEHGGRKKNLTPIYGLFESV